MSEKKSVPNTKVDALPETESPPEVLPPNDDQIEQMAARGLISSLAESMPNLEALESWQRVVMVTELQNALNAAHDNLAEMMRFINGNTPDNSPDADQMLIDVVNMSDLFQMLYIKTYLVKQVISAHKFL